MLLLDMQILWEESTASALSDRSQAAAVSLQVAKKNPQRKSGHIAAFRLAQRHLFFVCPLQKPSITRPKPRWRAVPLRDPDARLRTGRRWIRIVEHSTSPYWSCPRTTMDGRQIDRCKNRRDRRSSKRNEPSWTAGRMDAGFRVARCRALRRLADWAAASQPAGDQLRFCAPTPGPAGLPLPVGIRCTCSKPITRRRSVPARLRAASARILVEQSDQADLMKRRRRPPPVFLRAIFITGRGQDGV